MSKEILIQLNNASFNYPGEDNLFENLKFNIAKGDVSALVGINGAGKSTLLKLLTKEIETY